MSENTDNIPDSAEETERKQRILDEINEHTAKRINSWEDLYTGLRDQVYAYFRSPSRATADFTVTLLLTFVVALEENPEEGDARKIAEKMNELLVFGGERTGVSVSFTTKAETADPVTTALLGLLEAVKTLAPEDAATIANAKPTKRTLH